MTTMTSTITQTLWTRQQMLEALEEFAALYEKRPIQDNRGGMKSPHMFLSWFVLRALQPKAIIESGVFKGQGTWFFEQACPADLFCIEPDMKRIEYRTNSAVYSKDDFSKIDPSKFSKEKTVLFFDDHQNCVERVRQAHNMGFRHLIFEDNYPVGQGDCYSLKQALTKDGEDAAYLKDVIEEYEELPPVFTTELTRWGTKWADIPTPEPLLETVERPYQQVYKDEAQAYTWICYVRLKP